MKKIFTALACMVTITIFTSCGGGNSGKDTDGEKTEIGEIVGEMFKEAKKVNAFSQAAAERFIKRNGGLDPKSIEPDWKYIIDEKTMANYGDNSHGSLRFQKPDGEKLLQEEYEVWVRKVYNASKAISDDGRNIKGFEETDDKDIAVSEKTLEDMLEKAKGSFMGSLGMYEWGYRYKGKFMRVRLQREENNNKYAAEIDVADAMNKSMTELMKDAEKYLK